MILLVDHLFVKIGRSLAQAFFIVKDKTERSFKITMMAMLQPLHDTIEENRSQVKEVNAYE